MQKDFSRWLPGVCLVVLLALVSPGAFGQQNQEDQEGIYKKWIQVNAFMEKGLPRSALEVVDQLHALAVKELDKPLWVKAVLFKLKLYNETEEDAREKSVQLLREEIARAPFPADRLFHSLLAETYWSYYEDQRYEWLKRTPLAGPASDDIRDWDLKKLVEMTLFHHMKALDGSDRLKAIAVDQYKVIFETGSNTRELRPTLYDFLAHRAIDRFMDQETYLTKPAHHFTLDNPAYISFYQDFTKCQIDNRDTSAFSFHALGLLQNLIRFHASDPDPAALIDVDLKRLNYVHQHAVFGQADSLFLVTLEKTEEHFARYAASSLLSFQLATTLRELGNRFIPYQDEKHRYRLKQARQVCLEAVSRFPGSPGARQCQVLLQQLEFKSMVLKTDQVMVPALPFPVLLEYKNVQQMHYRVLPLTPARDREIKQLPSEKVIQAYLNVMPLKTGMYELPAEDDLQTHRAQLAMPALDPGYYVILLSDGQHFDVANNLIASASVKVSSIAYLEKKDSYDGSEIYVLDRLSGKALENVEVEVWNNEYDYSSRTRKEKLVTSLRTDKHGLVKITQVSQRNAQSNFLVFKKGKDALISESYFNFYQYSRPKPLPEVKTYLFTDRAIYRPGQTIYVKGIVLSGTGNMFSVKPGHQSLLALYDHNGKKVSEIKLFTNDFGSFSTTFIAPFGVLNGRMSISCETGSVSVQVEEYKRPSFEITLDPLGGTYRLNEVLTVSGTATMYAGSPADGARLEYRVLRKARFPYWYRGRGFLPSSPPVEIASGQSTTDQKGAWSFSFTAIPDASFSPAAKAVFDYELRLAVTDRNGETRSLTSIVSVGYVSVLLDVGLPERINRDEQNSFSLKASNLSGEKQDLALKATVWQLQSPGLEFRTRKWERPDRFPMSEPEFRKLFPLDIYDNEDQVSSREKVKQVFSADYQSGRDSMLVFPGMEDWAVGDYVIEIQANDSIGGPVSLRKYFSVFSSRTKRLSSGNPLWSVIPSGRYEPGTNLLLSVGSSLRDVSMMLEISREKEVIDRKWLQLDSEILSLPLVLTESDRGNLGVQIYMVKDNRVYASQGVIVVPFSNKLLDISFETFRDKLKPGEKEEWRIHIRGSKREQVAAELLLSMHDASLDAIKPHSWFLDLYRSMWNYPGWNERDAFTLVYSSHLGYPVTSMLPPEPTRVYDRLLYEPGHGFGGPVRYGLSSFAEAKGGRDLKAAGRSVEMADSQDMLGVQETPAKEDLAVADGSAEDIKPASRADFRETAFFFPHLSTNAAGDVLVTFTLPESLTRWRLMGLGHTRDASTSIFEKELTASKTLMLFPNLPRFFREGDVFMLSTKLSSLSTEGLQGEVTLELFDAITMKEVGNEVINNGSRKFSLPAGGSTAVDWRLTIPSAYQAIAYRISARAGNFTDVQEGLVPVLSDRALVTEALALPVRGKGSFQFTFSSLLDAYRKPSSTLETHQLSLEFTANPSWYAVMALPSLVDNSRESSDQLFNAFYASSISRHIIETLPEIKDVFGRWSLLSPSAFLSKLEKNPDLKSIALEETPWVMTAQSEKAQKQAIAALFNPDQGARAYALAISKLKHMQLPGGGWPWFAGLPEDRYMSQYIVAGLGHLQKLGIGPGTEASDVKRMLQSALAYLDSRIAREYNDILQYNPRGLRDNHLTHMNIQYLYARSFFLQETEVAAGSQEAFVYFKGQAQQYWLTQSIHLQAMIALALQRAGDEVTPMQILYSLKEKALQHEELGMYWKDLKNSYFWFHDPIGAQALLIEAFTEIMDDKVSVEEMKIWLLKNKQTRHWRSTSATADACYALLLRGTTSLRADEGLHIRVGEEDIRPFEDPSLRAEAGSGYVRKSWPGAEVGQDKASISVHRNDAGIAWGAVYWQYFEDMEKVKAAGGPFQVARDLYIERASPNGPVLEAVTEKNPIRLGDRVRVRIRLSSDRDLEYVHLKDLRASGLEPEDVISGTAYQDGLSFYQSTRDAATHFFFPFFPKGSRTFEFSLRASSRGDFSQGLTRAECLYAPEFSAHASGLSIKIE